MADRTEALAWRKSTFSGSGNDCVEVALDHAAGVALRDSKAPRAACLVFGRDRWTGFLAGVRAGEFSSRPS